MLVCLMRITFIMRLSVIECPTSICTIRRSACFFVSVVVLCVVDVEWTLDTIVT